MSMLFSEESRQTASKKRKKVSTWLNSLRRSIKADCDGECLQGFVVSVYTQLAVYYVHLAKNTYRLTCQINLALMTVLVFCKKKIHFTGNENRAL